MARLESHEDVEDVEIDQFATYHLASREEAPASLALDDVVSLEKTRLIRHVGLETTRSRQPSGAAHTVPSLFFIESAPNSTRGAKCRLPGCDRMIQPGDLRLAMYPGMDQRSRGRPNACTQPFSSANFTGLLTPLYFSIIPHSLLRENSRLLPSRIPRSPSTSNKEHFQVSRRQRWRNSEW